MRRRSRQWRIKAAQPRRLVSCQQKEAQAFPFAASQLDPGIGSSKKLLQAMGSSTKLFQAMGSSSKLLQLASIRLSQHQVSECHVSPSAFLHYEQLKPALSVILFVCHSDSKSFCALWVFNVYSSPLRPCLLGNAQAQAEIARLI